MSIAHDLSDAEFDELDDLLAATPAPLEPLDASMLDGYLAGVLVQPRLIPIEEWLPPVFDYEGRPLPDDVDPAWLARIRSAGRTRHAADLAREVGLRKPQRTGPGCRNSW